MEKRKRVPQAERSAASTQAMLDAAIELIVEQGARVSMMAIGERAGFSHGLVMARFGSKADLVHAVAKEVQRHFSAAVTGSTAHRTGYAGLAGAIETFFEQLSRNTVAGKAFYTLLGESLGPEPGIREIFVSADTAFRRFLMRFIVEAQEADDFDPTLDAQSIAALIVGMLRGIGMQYRVDPSSIQLGTARQNALTMVSRLAVTKAS